MGSYVDNAPSVVSLTGSSVPLSSLMSHVQPYGATALSLEVAGGVFITVSMVYYVLKQRSGVKRCALSWHFSRHYSHIHLFSLTTTLISRTNRVVNLVILYIINSGALNL